MLWVFPTSSLNVGRILLVVSRRKSFSNVAKAPLKCSCLTNSNDQRRTFLNFSGNSSRRKEYTGRKLLGHSMDELFNVVSDVENYYKFVPFCKKSFITSRSPKNLTADLVIGFPPITEQYTSKVTLIKPYLIKAEGTDGRLFNYLLTMWRFSPGLTDNPQSCVIDVRVMFEFRSLFHSNLANLFFDQVVMQMEGAFITETAKRYGKASIPMQIIKTRNLAKS